MSYYQKIYDLINEGEKRIHRQQQSSNPDVRLKGLKASFDPVLRRAERSGKVGPEAVRKAGSRGASLLSLKGDKSLHDVVSASTERILAGEQRRGNRGRRSR